jgi:hypothetical protein
VALLERWRKEGGAGAIFDGPSRSFLGFGNVEKKPKGQGKNLLAWKKRVFLGDWEGHATFSGQELVGLAHPTLLVDFIRHGSGHAALLLLPQLGVEQLGLERKSSWDYEEMDALTRKSELFKCFQSNF